MELRWSMSEEVTCLDVDVKLLGGASDLAELLMQHTGDFSEFTCSESSDVSKLTELHVRFVGRTKLPHYMRPWVPKQHLRHVEASPIPPRTAWDWILDETVYPE
jgi:hypothetical protein